VRLCCRCAISETGKVAFAPPNAPQATKLGGGDVVGVGWLPEHKKVFFTVNGALQHYVHNVVSSDKELKGLCPIIAGWTGLIITANFGQGEFAYKVCALCVASTGPSLLSCVSSNPWGPCVVVFLLSARGRPSAANWIRPQGDFGGDGCRNRSTCSQPRS
jgi:hypothetical protein